VIDWLRDYLSAPPDVWAPHLTLVLLLFFRPWGQHSPMGTLSGLVGVTYGLCIGAGLVLAPLAREPLFWFALTTIHFAWIYSAYHLADNHHYLEGYWCLSVALALGRPDLNDALARSATLLIGVVFLLASVWKLVSPSFTTGSFFLQSMLFDKRFLPISVWVGGLSAATQEAHRQARARAHQGVEFAPADVPRRLKAVAVSLTWWTIFIEVAVAIAFLVPAAFSDVTRVAVLVLFCITTYVLVPVPAFGHILVLLLLVSVPDGTLRMWLLAVSCLISVTPDMLVATYPIAQRSLTARRARHAGLGVTSVAVTPK
jgi:hypothetical protein